MKVVALVPIKLNSQRLPHKNILPIAGRPLCWHICHALNEVEKIDEVYVFCSDEKIKEYIPKETKILIRHPRLDQDEVKGFEIYAEFIKLVDADVYVLAHTTSPLIQSKTIANALGHVLNGSYDSAFSAQKLQTFVWYQGNPVNYDINDVPRTQDLEPVYVETSAFFIFQKTVFTKHHRRIGFKPYIQEVSDMEAVDIDEKEDYEFALKLIGEEV